MKKIYISGPISNNPDYEDFFENAENLLSNKFKVVNPCKLKHKKNISYVSYMKRDIKALLKCDFIFMLKDWEKSEGAKMEKNIAEFLKIGVMYER